MSSRSHVPPSAKYRCIDGSLSAGRRANCVASLSRTPCLLQITAPPHGPSRAPSGEGAISMRFTNILFPADNSDRCRRAVPLVTEAVKQFSSRLTLRHVVEYPPLAFYGD